MILSTFAGWSCGYTFSMEKSLEDAINQGKSHYLTALAQASESFYFANIIQNVTKLAPYHPLAKITSVACSILPFIAAPLFFYAAHTRSILVKNEKEKNFTKYISQILLTPLSKYSGSFMQVTVITSAVALIIFGNPFFGGALLAATAYQSVDSMGLVPRKISLLMETYMPLLASIGLLLTGGLVIQGMAVMSLLSYIPYIKTHIEHTSDKIFMSITQHLSPGDDIKKIIPSLVEADAPLIQNKKLSYEQIKEIMAASDDDFSINLAHASKPCMDLAKLPHDYNFTALVELTNKIDWESKYPLIRSKLKGDERFIDFLKETFPDQIDQIYTSFDTLLQTLAKKKNISVETFAANHVKEQMSALTSRLEGAYGSRAEGSQTDLEEAIEMASTILAYLKTLDPNTDKITIEDILIRLAIEGGEYCALGIKRVTRDLMPEIYASITAQEDDPVKKYEQEIQQRLEQLRFQIIQRELELPSVLSEALPIVHVHDWLFRLYALGFYPLTKTERYNFSKKQHVLRLVALANIKNDLQTTYKNELAAVVEEKGTNFFWNVYLPKMLGENDLLSKAQREEILDMSEDFDHLAEKEKALERLMFVMLGVLRRKPATSK